MHFLFDANVPRRAQRVIREVYRKHEFVAAWDDPFSATMEDLLLFETAQQQNIDVIITHDVVQMTGVDRRDERSKCFDCGLHWLGLPQPFKATGKVAKLGHISGALLANLSYAVSVFETAQEPTAILLKPNEAQLQAERFFPQPICLPG